MIVVALSLVSLLVAVIVRLAILVVAIPVGVLRPLGFALVVLIALAVSGPVIAVVPILGMIFMMLVITILRKRCNWRSMQSGWRCCQS